MKLVKLLERLEGYHEEFVEALRNYRLGAESIYSVERLAQLISQVILDFAAVLVSKRRGKKPETYRDLAKWLSEVTDPSFEDFLEGMAGFRNILVHMYADIDRDLEMRAFEELAERVPELIRYLRELADDPCLDQVRRIIRDKAPELGIRLVFVFGSLARDECGNDVDLAVKLEERPRSMLDIGRLQVELEALLGAPVDLIVLNLDVDPALAKTIVDEAILIYGDEGEGEEEILKLYKKSLDALAYGR
ncbi:MAG: DUF86 domain-containing protein [Candidatus Korarchaeota archaeon]|nr:DUF86 domain-containing protein [Candidatus Korarchaeota archaeon]